MRKKIHKNLVGIAALAIILTIGLTFWAYFMMLQKQIFQDLQTDVHVLASSDYIVDTLEQNYDANADGLRITLISKDGSVLYESKGNASKMENHMERPEVQQALKNGEGKATRRSNTIGTLSFYYAEKLHYPCIQGYSICSKAECLSDSGGNRYFCRDFCVVSDFRTYYDKAVY